jgi:hypothetical protein
MFKVDYKKDAQKGRSEKKRNRKTAALGNLKLALAGVMLPLCYFFILPLRTMIFR